MLGLGLGGHTLLTAPTLLSSLRCPLLLLLGALQFSSLGLLLRLVRLSEHLHHCLAAPRVPHLYSRNLRSCTQDGSPRRGIPQQYPGPLSGNRCARRPWSDHRKAMSLGSSDDLWSVAVVTWTKQRRASVLSPWLPARSGTRLERPLRPELSAERSSRCWWTSQQPSRSIGGQLRSAAVSCGRLRSAAVGCGRAGRCTSLLYRNGNHEELDHTRPTGRRGFSAS